MRIKNASCLWLNKALKRYGLYEYIQEKENTRIKEKAQAVFIYNKTVSQEHFSGKLFIHPFFQYKKLINDT